MTPEGTDVTHWPLFGLRLSTPRLELRLPIHGLEPGLPLFGR